MATKTVCIHELTDKQLNRLVAELQGWMVIGRAYVNPEDDSCVKCHPYTDYDPSNDWKHCGPLIEQLAERDIYDTVRLDIRIGGQNVKTTRRITEEFAIQKLCAYTVEMEVEDEK